MIQMMRSLKDQIRLEYANCVMHTSKPMQLYGNTTAELIGKLLKSGPSILSDISILNWNKTYRNENYFSVY